MRPIKWLYFFTQVDREFFFNTSPVTVGNINEQSKSSKFAENIDILILSGQKVNPPKDFICELRPF